MISIIVGYRNREIERVKRSLDSLANQNYTDFEMIFVDYGSDTLIATEIENLVTSYKFTKYIYSDTRGWFWNRAHALNTGVKFASGNIILFFDIDLILESNFLETLSALSFETTFYTFSCFYLPENFTFFNDLLNRGVHCEQNYVGLCAVNKENFHKIRGFDEYFMVWGVEDDDFYNRLELINVKRVQLGQPNYFVFHQWHKTQSPSAPNAWYLEMVQYLFNSNTVIRNSESWGKIVEKKDRFFYNHEIVFPDEKKIIIEYSSSLLIFNEFIEKFFDETVDSGSAIIKIPLLIQKNVKCPFRKNKIIENRESFDVSYNFLTYFIAKNRKLLLDYNFNFRENELDFSYIKNNP